MIAGDIEALTKSKFGQEERLRDLSEGTESDGHSMATQLHRHQPLVVPNERVGGILLECLCIIGKRLFGSIRQMVMLELGELDVDGILALFKLVLQEFECSE